jgi:hypothetical protein
MLWLIFAILLGVGVAGFLASSTLAGGVFQLLLISTLLALGINRIRVVSSRMRRYEVD